MNTLNTLKTFITRLSLALQVMRHGVHLVEIGLSLPADSELPAILKNQAV